MVKDNGLENAAAVPAIATTVITGYAGSGKSTALDVFEDEGHYCVENLPAFLLPELVNGLAARPGHGGRLAVVMDSRDVAFPKEFQAIFTRMGEASHPVTLLFLEASEEVLLRRYSQMRRVHPRAAGGSVRKGIRREREELQVLRRAADRIIDTSELSPHELRRLLLEQLGDARRSLQITFTSFGFKHGSPVEADLLFDVRFLPNPYFVPALSGRTGLETEVAAYVLDNEDARRFLDLIRPLLAFLIPQYRREGKTYLTIGIGCTGGRHRSVAVTEHLAKLIGTVAGERVLVRHRDLDQGAK